MRLDSGRKNDQIQINEDNIKIIFVLLNYYFILNPYAYKII